VTTSKQQKSDPRVIVPKPNRMRQMGKQGFGWLDARLHKQGWLAIMTPDEIAAYTGVSLILTITQRLSPSV
jgi:hypothetical protein